MVFFNGQGRYFTTILLAVLLLSGCGGAEERKAKYLELAKTYFEEGNFDKARVEFHNVLQIDPKTKEPYYYLGKIEVLTDEVTGIVSLKTKAFDPIVAKAMARDLAERYPSARELASDLKRFQTGQLVSVHQYSAWNLVRRWLWRHRSTVAVVATATVLLAVFGAISVSQMVDEAERARAGENQALSAAHAPDPRARTGRSTMARVTIVTTDAIGASIRERPIRSPSSANEVAPGAA